MAEYRTHLTLSAELLENAEFVVAEISRNATAKKRLERTAYHCFYYSIYHKYIHCDPSIRDKSQKIKHKDVLDKISKRDSFGGQIYRKMKENREWADYNPVEKSGIPNPMKLERMAISYRALCDLINNIKQD
jgi:tRNA G10  N-methylase Trm11